MFAWLRRKPKVPVSRLAPAVIQTALGTAQQALAAGDPRRVFETLTPLLEDAVVHPEACHVAALAACASGDFPRAASLLESATTADPTRIASWHTLGEVRLEMRDGAAAVEAFRSLLAQDPAYRAAHDRLLTALGMAGRHDEALVTYQMHRALDWTFDVLANPAAALQAQGRLDEAVDLLRKRISFERGNARLWTYLGRTRHAQGHLDTAIACFREAVKADPDYPQARRGLAFALDSAGEVADAIEHYRVASDLLAGDAQSYSDYLAAQLYVGWPSVDDARVAYEEYDRRFGRAGASPAVAAVSDGAPRRLRIGYVSGDFGEHAITYFFEPLLEHHDRSRFEVWCYDRTPQQDAAGIRLAGKADHWQRVHGVAWDDLAQKVRSDGIDILVDLKGHFDDNHLPLFARKPAPAQATWLGYPDTTGMKAIDGWFTDDVIVEDLSGQYAAETVTSLGPFFMCFRPKADAPSPTAPPAVSRGHVTFGCFNSYAKISPEMREAIADILVAIPDSRCLFTAVPRGNARERLLDLLEQRGVERGRVEIRGRGGHDEFLRWHEEVDITLDSFPYNGTTTALHSLWMGVPLVTLAGTTHVSRVGASILTNLGMSDWIAADRDAYVALAVAGARDIDALARLRGTLRERVRNSSVMDEPGFVRRFESACVALLRTAGGTDHV